MDEDRLLRERWMGRRSWCLERTRGKKRVKVAAKGQ